MSKFEHYGIKGHLLVWSENFFTARTQHKLFLAVPAVGAHVLTAVPSGVIQGSELT